MNEKKEKKQRVIQETIDDRRRTARSWKTRRVPSVRRRKEEKLTKDGFGLRSFRVVYTIVS